MSIVAYTGKPGSGKTYSVVSNIILQAVEKNVPIYTNIPIKTNNLFRDYPNYDPEGFHQLTTEDFLDEPILDQNGNPTGKSKATETLKKIPAGSLIVIDEIGTICPVGVKQSKYSREFLEFWSKHRHKVKDGHSQEIVIICQDLSQIMKFIRDLVELTYITTKLQAISLANVFRVDVHQGGITDFPSTDAKTFIKSKQERYNEKIFSYYESHTLKADSVTNLKGGIYKKKVSIWDSFFFKYIMPLSLIMILGSYYYIFNVLFASNTSSSNPKTSSEDAKITKQKTVNSEPFFKDFKYDGYIEIGQKKYAIISRKDGSKQTIDFNRHCFQDEHLGIKCNYFGKKYNDDL